MSAAAAARQHADVGWWSVNTAQSMVGHYRMQLAESR